MQYLGNNLFSSWMTNSNIEDRSSFAASNSLSFKMTFLSRYLASLTVAVAIVVAHVRIQRSIDQTMNSFLGQENICLTDAHEILQGRWDCGSLTFNDDPAVVRYSIELEHALLFRCHYMYRYTLYIHIHYTGCLNNKMKIQNQLHKHVPRPCRKAS